MTTAAEYRRVFRDGVRLDGPLFLLVAAVNALGFSRLGLVASRRLGGAAARNRAKRLLREGFRRLKPVQAQDLVFMPKGEILETTATHVERECRERLRRLAARGPTKPRRTRAPAAD